MTAVLATLAAGVLLVMALILGRFAIECAGVIGREYLGLGRRRPPVLVVEDDPFAPVYTWAAIAATLPRDIVEATLPLEVSR